jgi:D-glycero-D-manno-heptose 1,7-bisphosphate phosphatase
VTPSTAFLDRDGTINAKAAQGSYVTRPDDLRLLPRAAAAIHRLNQAGVRVIVVTNQRGVALGRMTAEDVANVNRALGIELAKEAARVDAMYVYLMAAQEDPAIDLDDAVMVGDSCSDMGAAAALGCPGILIRDAVRPGDVSDCTGARVDHVARSLWDAVDWLLRD